METCRVGLLKGRVVPPCHRCFILSSSLLSAQITCCSTCAPACCPWPQSPCLGVRRVSARPLKNAARLSMAPRIWGALRSLPPRWKHSLLPPVLVPGLRESRVLGLVSISSVLGGRWPPPLCLQVFLPQDQPKEPLGKLGKQIIPLRPLSPKCGLENAH